MVNVIDNSAPININVLSFEDFNTWNITNPVTPVLNVENNGLRLSVDGLPGFPCYRAKKTGVFNAFTLAFDFSLLSLSQAQNPYWLGGQICPFIITDSDSVNCYSDRTISGTNSLVCYLRRVTTYDAGGVLTDDTIEFWYREFLNGVGQGNNWSFMAYYPFLNHPLFQVTNMLLTKTATSLNLKMYQNWSTTPWKNYTITISSTPNYTRFITGANFGASGGPSTYTSTADIQNLTFS